MSKKVRNVTMIWFTEEELAYLYYFLIMELQRIAQGLGAEPNPVVKNQLTSEVNKCRDLIRIVGGGRE